jgi:hypothetical protein
VGRPQTARDDQQVAGKPLAQRLLQLVGRIPDDSHFGGVDSELEEGSRQKRTVRVGAVATHELGARDEDGRPWPSDQPSCQPVGVTVITRGR